MPFAVKIILIVVVSYLAGNINFAVILSRIKHGDIRKSGSGNPGTMNVIRSYGKVVGARSAWCWTRSKRRSPRSFSGGCSLASRARRTISWVFTYPDCPQSWDTSGRCS